MTGVGPAAGLAAFLATLIISWPLVIVAWSLPARLFDHHRPAAAPRVVVLVVALLPSVATIWAITTLPAIALPGGLVLAWTLICLSVVDARIYILPNCLTFPLIVLGLVHAVALASAFSGDEDALAVGLLHAFAAGLGYLALASIAIVFRKLRKKEGLGLGDAKLFAAAGAWLGIASLPSVLLVAAVTALIVILGKACLVNGSPVGGTEPIPFGPYLAAATWVVFLYGPLAFN